MGMCEICDGAKSTSEMPFQGTDGAQEIARLTGDDGNVTSEWSGSTTAFRNSTSFGRKQWEIGYLARAFVMRAKSTSEMPCSKVLTEFGKILYQVVERAGPAAQMAMAALGNVLDVALVVYIHHLRKGAKFTEISCMAFISGPGAH